MVQRLGLRCSGVSGLRVYEFIGYCLGFIYSSACLETRLPSSVLNGAWLPSRFKSAPSAYSNTYEYKNEAVWIRHACYVHVCVHLTFRRVYVL